VKCRGRWKLDCLEDSRRGLNGSTAGGGCIAPICGPMSECRSVCVEGEICSEKPEIKSKHENN
jgi:hypothetical protein